MFKHLTQFINGGYFQVYRIGFWPLVNCVKKEKNPNRKRLTEEKKKTVSLINGWVGFNEHRVYSGSDYDLLWYLG